jgi:hypothetical protein
VRHNHRSISLLLLISIAWLSGCSQSQAHSATAHQLAPGAQSPASAAPIAKHAPRDSAFAVYSNPDYSVSFRYPRNFFLNEELDSNDPSILDARQKLSAQQPGAILLATVNIPQDAHPNTTFRNGTLQFVVNPVVTPEICQTFAAPLDEAFTSGSSTLQGVTFSWRQRGYAAAGTGYLDRDYAGFANGACYEFFLELVTGSNPDSNPSIKEADDVKIMGKLDRIVTSLRIRPGAAAAARKPLPVVDTFTVESIPHPLLQNVVRVTWEISNVNENEVFLRVNCPGGADLNPLPDSNSPESAPRQVAAKDATSLEDAPDRYSRPTYSRLESIFTCNSFTPIPARSGTFRLQIEDRSSEPVSFTLFAFGLSYITQAP